MKLETKYAIIRAAGHDAETFADEFPGEMIRDDWDSHAWMETARELDLSDDDMERGWELYREELHRKVSGEPT